MPLSPGDTLAHYRVIDKLGEGGMGEVYRAEDTKLSRQVALKLLPAEFARDAERMGRFSREAQLLASLNHPNIAAIYGLEESGDVRCLVLELVEGEDLSERLKRGPLPLDEAVEIAAQIASALEEAHDRGIVHRDLKPANIKLTPDGKVKVLDFGLAKAYAGDAAEGGSDPVLSLSPTMTQAAGTAAGVILGTASYMSPEQARGKPVDRRADLWGFGVVLYEMLTGPRLFPGDTATDIIAAVVTRDPDWSLLPASTPPGVRRLLRRCLEKDPRRRLRDAGDARLELEEAVAGPEAQAADEHAAGAAAQPAPARARWWLGVAAGLALGLLAAAVIFGGGFLSPDEPGVTWSALLAPEGHSMSFSAGLAELSPDGRHLVFAATSDEGEGMLWVRSLDSMEARALPGTEEGLFPFWSPDSRWIGFFSGRKLRKVDLNGGAPVALCEAGEAPRGAVWGPDDTILFSPSWNVPLQRVAASGGTPEPATELAASRQELSHRWPHFLPDGRHFLYYTVSTYPAIRPTTPDDEDASGLYLGSLDGGEPRLIQKVRSRAAYVDGRLLYVRDGTLMAQPFDLKTLDFAGDPVALVDGVTQSVGALWGAALFSASAQGNLALVRGAPETVTISRLVWMNRAGQDTGTVGEPGPYRNLRLSHDGRRAAVAVGDPGDIWLHDLVRESSNRFTFDSGDDILPVWSPDDGRIMFQSARVNPGKAFSPGNLYQRVTSGLGDEELVLDSEDYKEPSDWSPDGRHVLILTLQADTGWDVWLYTVDDGSVVPFLQEEHNEGSAVFSPDGRWVAYASDESGRSEIYVRAFPGPGGKWQVSAAGGNLPTWNPAGEELFYLGLDDALMAAPLETDGGFSPGNPERLFEMRLPERRERAYDVAPDGEGFLVIEPLPEEGEATRLVTLVQGWEKLVGG